MPLGKSYQEHRAEEIERDPALTADLRDASVELGLGIALDRLRRQRGLTQRQLAELSGIKQPVLARIERGNQSPGIAVLTRILAALNGSLTIGPDGTITGRAADVADGQEVEWNGSMERSAAGLAARTGG